jgi:hypothetical protein
VLLHPLKTVLTPQIYQAESRINHREIGTGLVMVTVASLKQRSKQFNHLKTRDYANKSKQRQSR